MEDGFEGCGGGWPSDQLGGVGVTTWTREVERKGGCSKAFMRLGVKDGSQHLGGSSLSEMGDVGQGDGFGGSKSRVSLGCKGELLKDRHIYYSPRIPGY